MLLKILPWEYDIRGYLDLCLKYPIRNRINMILRIAKQYDCSCGRILENYSLAIYFDINLITNTTRIVTLLTTTVGNCGI